MSRPRRKSRLCLAGLFLVVLTVATLGWLHGTGAGKRYRLARMDRKSLSAWVNSHPGDSQARRILGDLLMRQGWPLEAARVFREAGEIEPNAIWPRIGQARAFLEAGQIEQAEPILKDALSRAPEDADANAALGELHYSAGNPEMAESAFLVAARHDSRNVAAQAGLAFVFADKKNLTDAQVAARRVAEAAPGSGAAYRALGYVEDRAGNAEEAVRYLTLAAQREPNRGQTWSLLAAASVRAARSRQAYRKAHAALDHAAKLLPGLAEIPYNRGLLLTRQGRHREAIAEYRAALERNPNFTSALYQLAAALALTGQKAESAAVRARFDRARDYEREMVQLRLRAFRQPERSDLWRRLKELAEDNGDMTAARIAEQRLQESLASRKGG